MEQVNARKKNRRPADKKGEETLETIDLAQEVPQVNDLVDEIDRMIAETHYLTVKQDIPEKPQIHRCGC
jgi:hypothetical protein